MAFSSLFPLVPRLRVHCELQLVISEGFGGLQISVGDRFMGLESGHLPDRALKSLLKFFWNGLLRMGLEQ